MRLFVELVFFWTLVALLLGMVGRAWVEQAWTSHIESSFRRDVSAAVAIAEARRWQRPAEADPDWQAMEKNLGLGVIPIAEFVSDGEQTIEWSRVAKQGYRLSMNAPLVNRMIDSSALRITRQIEKSQLSYIWWMNWGLLNACAYGLACVGLWAIHRDSRFKKGLLRPWFEALEARRRDGVLLPQVEPQDSDFCLQMDAVADSINRIYAELSSANERAELVLGNLREGVLAVDDRSRILLANTALRRSLNLTDEKFLYRPLLEVIRTPVIASLVRGVLNDGGAREEQVEYGPEPKHLRILVRPLPFPDRRTGALVTVRDETMLKRVDLIKRDFVANASHELKTPLAAIRAYAETLQMGALDDRPTAESFVGNIIAQADRMNALVQGMLQLSRVEVGAAVRFQDFDACEALEPCIAAVQAIASGKDVRIVVNLPESPIMIKSDRDGYQTIASNLLSNGVRYTSNHGTVTVSLTQVESELILEIRDTGIGMNPEDLERIFERFYRAKKDRSADTGGTGLGLSIVKHLTQALGGSVRAESQLGEGSSFVVHLPLRPIQEQPKAG